MSEGAEESGLPPAPTRLLADENFPGPSVELLRTSGHDVAWVSEGRSGISDQHVLAWGRREGRIVLTFDRDLAERLVRYHDPPPAGLVRDLRLAGRLTVVDHHKVRQRPLLSAG